MDFTPAPLNPFNILVFRGGRVKDDEGRHWLDSLVIAVPFDAEEDVKDGRTSLTIDMEHGTLPNPNENGYGSKYLLLTRPVMSQAVLETLTAAIQTTYDNDIDDYYKNNTVGITEDNLIHSRDDTIKNCYVAFAQAIDEKTKKPALETYRLKVPSDVATGQQLYLHGYCWQGETWNSRHDGSSGELRGFPNIAGFTDNSPLSLAAPYTKIVGYLIYHVAIFGNEEKDLHRLIATPNTTPKKVIDRLQATKNAKAAQDQANALNRGGNNPSNPTTSSTTHHHRNHNHATTTSHHHSPPRGHTTRTHYVYQTGTGTPPNQHYAHQTGTQNQQNQSYAHQTGTQHQQNQSYAHQTATYKQPFTQQEHTTTQQDFDPFYNEHTTTQHDQYHDRSAYNTESDGGNGGGRNYNKDEESDEHLVSLASASQMEDGSEDQRKPPAWTDDTWARGGTTNAHGQTDGMGGARAQDDGMGGEYNGGYARGYYRG